MKIGVLIPEVGFEKVRDRIMEIIMDEFRNQVSEFNNQNCVGVNFFAERMVPMDANEADYIDISLFKGDYSNKDVEFVDGTYQFALSIVTGSKTKRDDRGDKLANFRLQKLIGIVRYILEHPNYTALLFTPPFIEHTMLSRFQVYRPEPGSDTKNTATGQAIFTVRCGEVTTPNEGTLLTDSVTSVKMGLSDKGYRYQYLVDSPAPPVDTRYVYIKDQFGNVLEQLVGGDSYTVEVLQEIIDTITANQSTIIDPLTP